MLLACKDKIVDLSRPTVMGVLNVTPDSFSDGGQFQDPQAAVAHGLEMVAQGADIIDIGGESTRPNAPAVSTDQELQRVLPVVQGLSKECSVPISIDTSNSTVMTQAVAVGAGMINDVRALTKAGALDAAAKCGVPVCLMHMQGEPQTMQQNPEYTDVVLEVKHFLLQRKRACLDAGIPRQDIILDPGFGFGKDLTHNLKLLRHLRELLLLESPILVGLSRKSMLQAILDKPVQERLFGSLALAVIAVCQGASIVRAHDVAATKDAMQVCHAVLETDQVKVNW